MNNINNGSRHIVVEGPIGVGKTSLAERLARHYSADLLLEQPTDNPFLERFYRDPKHNALPAQLSFLFQRARQLEDICQRDLFCPNMVADFLFAKDRLFASLNLDDKELRLYDMVYEQLAPSAVKPDLIIYLQAPVSVLMNRVQKRGTEYEQQISSDYLLKVSEAYTKFFHYYDESPLLIVNVADIDLVNNDKHYKDLLERIENMGSGKHYYNPAPSI